MQSTQIREIGKGNSGVVTACDHFVYKNTNDAEADIHERLVNCPGIAPAACNDSRLTRRRYDSVISIDTVKGEDERRACGDLVRKNFRRILRAVNAVTAIGYSYNDPLQFGTNGEKMDLLDFGNAQKDSVYAAEDNRMHLRIFLENFGAPELAKLISDASAIERELHLVLNFPDYIEITALSPDPSAAQALEVLSELRSAEEDADTAASAENIYYSLNTSRRVASTCDDIRIGQTEGIGTAAQAGVKFIFSASPLSAAFCAQWEIIPLFERTDPACYGMRLAG